MSASKAEKLYRGVPAEQVEALRRFRAEHPYRTVVIAGRPWQYISGGQGETAILLLPGSLSTGESTWPTFLELEPRYRVLSPTYAAVPTMDELADGIAGLLDTAGIRKAVVIGSSYGGMVAQVFARRHPDRTESLVLSHTILPDAARGRKIAASIRWFRHLPIGVLRAIFRKKMGGLLGTPRPETALFRAYLLESVARDFTKESMIPGYERVVDFDTRHRFTPDDLAGWPGRVLLLLTDNDPATPEPVREQMRALYPNAEVQLFHGTGHATPILQREAYNREIEAFLAAGVSNRPRSQ